MTITSIITGPIGWIGGMAISATIGGYITNYATSKSKEIEKLTVEKIRAEIDKINDENLKEMAIHGVRCIASKMPDAPSNVKLQACIKLVQDATPNILVSDEKVKLIIESVYTELKKDLQSV